MKKNTLDTVEENQGKIHNIEKYGRKDKEVCWSGHAQQDFGRGSTGEGNAGGKGSTWEEWVEGYGEVR